MKERAHLTPYQLVLFGQVHEHLDDPDKGDYDNLYLVKVKSQVVGREDVQSSRQRTLSKVEGFPCQVANQFQSDMYPENMGGG